MSRHVLRRVRRGLLLPAVAALAAAVPMPAHAQFGKLIKKAAQGVAEGKARDAAGNAAGGEAAQQASGRASTLVPITTESLDLLLAALEPTAKAASEYEAARARYEATEKKIAVRKSCRDSVGRLFASAVMVPSKAAMDAQVKYGEQVGDLMQRLGAANQAGDAARVKAITDTIGMLGERMENAMVPALAKCGPYVPSAGVSPSAPQGAAPKVPDGMTPTQFGRLRERVAAWLVTNGQYKVSAEERGALEGRKQRLDALTPLFRGSARQWTSWGDLQQER
jgi:hypothetical protein